MSQELYLTRRSTRLTENDTTTQLGQKNKAMRGATGNEPFSTPGKAGSTDDDRLFQPDVSALSPSTRITLFYNIPVNFVRNLLLRSYLVP